MRYKILHIIETLGTGGAERSLTENIKHMPDIDHVVVIFSEPQDFSHSILQAGARIINLRTSKRKIFRNIYEIFKIIREVQPDLVHTTLYYANQAGRVAGKLANKPVLSNIVDTYYDPIRYIHEPSLRPWKHKILKHIDRLTAWHTQCHFMAISEFVKQSAIKETHFPAAKISVIYRGVSLPAQPMSPTIKDTRAARHVDFAGFPILLNIGRLVPAKGQIILVEAMPQILEAFPKALLLFAGSGDLIDTLRSRAVALGVDKNLSFLGKRSDTQELLALADLFVFPSIWEGLGVSLLEAMAMGKPVIASNAGPFPEVVEHGRSGQLVEPGSSGAIARAVIALAKSKEDIFKMGCRSRQIIEDKFDIRNASSKIEKLYVELISGSKVTVGL